MKSYVGFQSAAKIPEIYAFSNIAQRLKSGLSSNLKVRLHCVYNPLRLVAFFFLKFTVQTDYES